MDRTLKRKSNNGKYIALTIVALLATTITFAVLWAQEISKDPNEGVVDRSVKICLEPSCVSAAESLNKAMNRSINPCDDFYEFACGGWNRTEVMPDDKARWQVFDVLRRDLIRNLKSVLTTTANGTQIPGSGTATEKMQKYYKSCVDLEAITGDRGRSLKQHLDANYGTDLANWPYLNSTQSAINVSETVKNALKYGNSLSIFNNYIDANPFNASKNEINFVAGRFTLDRFSLVNESKADVRAAYVNYGAEVAVLLNQRIGDGTMNKTAAMDVFNRILSFEIELANATRTPAESRNKNISVNPSTIGEFATSYTSSVGLTGANWVDAFRAAWPDAASLITTDTVINVGEPAYYQKVNELLARSNNNRADVLSNFLAWKVIEPFINRLDSDFRAIYLKFMTVVQGTTADVPRTETCVDVVTGHFPNAVGSLYVRNFFRKEAKEELEVMIKYLLDAFRNIIKTSYWMREETRVKALEKANKIVSRLAYDDYQMNNVAQVNSEHEEFVAVDDYLENYAEARRFATKVEGKLYAKGNKNTDWITGPAIVNAFYSPNHNSISFPAGILQAPFLGNGYPHYWNFAAVGTVIGHEITHGFDDQGSQTDGDGSLQNWWDPESLTNFKARAQGIIDQYSSYNLLGVQLQGVNNQGENIADNGGLRESYEGYQAYRKEHLNNTDEPRLPGFETFNTDQMFYLSYAQVWCGDYRKQEMELQASRAHSPGKFRVIGPLQNSHQFAHAYRCASDTYMNPAKKAAVW